MNVFEKTHPKTDLDGSNDIFSSKMNMTETKRERTRETDKQTEAESLVEDTDIQKKIRKEIDIESITGNGKSWHIKKSFFTCMKFSNWFC